MPRSPSFQLPGRPAHRRRHRLPMATSGGAYVAIAHSFVIADLKSTLVAGAPASTLPRTSCLLARSGSTAASGSSSAPTPATRAPVRPPSTARSSLARSALAWADPDLLQTFVAGFIATESDPLAQRAAAGWKGWAGGALMNLSGSYRHVVIQSPRDPLHPAPGCHPAPRRAQCRQELEELMANTTSPRDASRSWGPSTATRSTCRCARWSATPRTTTAIAQAAAELLGNLRAPKVNPVTELEDLPQTSV